MNSEVSNLVTECVKLQTDFHMIQRGWAREGRQRSLVLCRENIYLWECSRIHSINTNFNPQAPAKLQCLIHLCREYNIPWSLASNLELQTAIIIQLFENGRGEGEARGGAVGWGTAWVLFPMASLEFFINIILPAALWSWGRLTSNRNEYQEYFLENKGCRCVALTNIPPSSSDFMEIWEPQIPGALWACNRPEQGLLYLYLYSNNTLRLHIVPNYSNIVIFTQRNTVWLSWFMFQPLLNIFIDHIPR
jgi:hypothetical protein